MNELKMPEMNYVLIAGNLTRDPVFRNTENGTHVVNFTLASNRKFKDSSNKWQEQVCFVGVVAWNKLAASCKQRLKKGSAVIVDGELQSRFKRSEDGTSRQLVEIKARKIQFLNKKSMNGNGADDAAISEDSEFEIHDEVLEFSDDAFDKFLTDEESQLLNNSTNNQ